MDHEGPRDRPTHMHQSNVRPEEPRAFGLDFCMAALEDPRFGMPVLNVFSAIQRAHSH